MTASCCGQKLTVLNRRLTLWSAHMFIFRKIALLMSMFGEAEL